jgi:hypothetical protein
MNELKCPQCQTVFPLAEFEEYKQKVDELTNRIAEVEKVYKELRMLLNLSSLF